MADGREANVLVRLERPEDRVGGLEEVAVVRRRPAQVRDHDLRRLPGDAGLASLRGPSHHLVADRVRDRDDRPDDVRRSLVQRARCSRTPLPPPSSVRRQPLDVLGERLALELVHAGERRHEREARRARRRGRPSRSSPACPRRGRGRRAARSPRPRRRGAGRTPRSGLRPSRGRSTRRPRCVRCRPRAGAPRPGARSGSETSPRGNRRERARPARTRPRLLRARRRATRFPRRSSRSRPSAG